MPLSQVLVSGLGGKTRCLQFTTLEVAVGTLKARLAQTEGIPAADQKLLLAGTDELTDEATLTADEEGFLPSCSLVLRLTEERKSALSLRSSKKSLKKELRRPDEDLRAPEDDLRAAERHLKRVRDADGADENRGEPVRKERREGRVEEAADLAEFWDDIFRTNECDPQDASSAEHTSAAMSPIFGLGGRAPTPTTAPTLWPGNPSQRLLQDFHCSLTVPLSEFSEEVAEDGSVTSTPVSVLAPCLVPNPLLESKGAKEEHAVWVGAL